MKIEIRVDHARQMQVLLYHVVSGKVTSDMITNDAVVPTVEGSIHRVNVYLKSDYYDVRRSIEQL